MLKIDLDVLLFDFVILIYDVVFLFMGLMYDQIMNIMDLLIILDLNNVFINPFVICFMWCMIWLWFNYEILIIKYGYFNG